MEKNRQHARRAVSAADNSALTSREILMLKKKRRRRKKLLIFFAVLLCLAAAGGAGFFLWQRSRSAAQAVLEISAGENEEIIYARINTIVGNEMEVSLLSGSMEEEGQSAGGPAVAEPAEAETEEAETAETETAETETGRGPDNAILENASDSGRQNGAEPSSGMAAEGMPEEGMAAEGMPGEGGAAEGAQRQSASGFSSGRRSQSAYTETGETREWQIPVGTDVITTLGVTTTFSRLSAGNVIAVLTEAGTDNILKIWIVQ